MIRCQSEDCPGYPDDFLAQLRCAIDIRSSTEFKSYSWDSARWYTALSGEVGELGNLIKKEFRGDSIPPLIMNRAIEDECADILIYLIAFCIHRNINLQKATISKFNETSRKRGYVTMLT